MSKIFLRNFEQFEIDKFNEGYKKKNQIENLNGVSLFHEPFTHCVINDLVCDKTFVDDLNKEILSKLKYIEKNNDLYKFHQTSELTKKKLEKLSEFRDKFLYGSFLEFLKKITEIELSSSKIDVTSSKYEFSDYLLCHDDNILNSNNTFGRRIAFIYYLVPDEWDTDGKDGGNLDLFEVNDSFEPINIVKSLTPKRNTLAFFEVSDRSFHQVSEIFAKSKTRLSINGWFHGTVNTKQKYTIQRLPEPELDFINIDWISEKYLKPTNQTDIQLKFTSSSEIKLDKVFNPHKYEQLANSLNSESIKWVKKGPANRRNYEVAEFNTLPDIVKELIQILSSECMGLTLSNMTGLALHKSVKKINDEDNDEEDFSDESNDEYEDEDSGDFDEEESNNQNNEQDEYSDNEINHNIETSIKRKQNFDSNEHQPCTSSSLNKNEASTKKLKTDDKNDTVDDNDISKNTNPSTSAYSTDISNDTVFTGRLSYEIRRWKQGSYTLVTDDDNEIRKKALDLMVFLKCDTWSLKCGGNVSYIARDEDTELLTVNPEENCMSMVYRDEETLKFTKFVNSNINKINNDGCFYEISFVYYE